MNHGPLMVAELSGTQWPSIIAVNTLPLKRNAIGPDGKPRQPGL
jgi:hypothetical protein